MTQHINLVVTCRDHTHTYSCDTGVVCDPQGRDGWGTEYECRRRGLDPIGPGINEDMSLSPMYRYTKPGKRPDDDCPGLGVTVC